MIDIIFFHLGPTTFYKYTFTHMILTMKSYMKMYQFLTTFDELCTNSSKGRMQVRHKKVSIYNVPLLVALATYSFKHKNHFWL
jgi:hypothetical protein